MKSSEIEKIEVMDMFGNKVNILKIKKNKDLLFHGEQQSVGNHEYYMGQQDHLIIEDI